VISSPYAATGALYELHRKHYAVPGNVLVWVGAAHVMNPGLSPRYLEKLRTDDPELYKSAVAAEFRSAAGSLFDPELLELCVVRGARELVG
jgi:hypothetical protein